jgi:hypothetical protein
MSCLKFYDCIPPDRSCNFNFVGYPTSNNYEWPLPSSVSCWAIRFRPLGNRASFVIVNVVGYPTGNDCLI